MLGVSQLSKISSSSIQFRQLINSLKKKQMPDVDESTTSNLQQNKNKSLTILADDQDSPRPRPRTNLMRSNLKIKELNLPVKQQLDPSCQILIVQEQQKQQSKIQKSQLMQIIIRDINEDLLIQYCKKESPLTQSSNPQDIFSFYNGMCAALGINLSTPYIKKYKNCVYFGCSFSSFRPYEGFIYFFDGHFYFGQFKNQLKHGKGTEFNWKLNIKYKGYFSQGRKQGKFFVSKPNESYIGMIQNGLYHGQGKLTTSEYVYEGYFQKGLKHGYGEQKYLGITLAGIYKEGKLQQQIQKQINSLNAKEIIIKKKSLQRHNAKMLQLRKKQNYYQYESQPNKEFEQILQNDSIKKQNILQTQMNNFLQTNNIIKKKNIGKITDSKSYLKNKQIFQQNNKKTKLRVYLQHRRKPSLPKICQEYSYSIDKSSKYDLHQRLKCFNPQDNIGDTISFQNPLPLPTVNLRR